MKDFQQRLAEGVLLADGAMGTVLQDMGLHPPFDMACLTHPEWVADAHRRYLDAGSELVETITYSSNRVKLDLHDLGDRVVEINRAAVRLAREAVGDKAYVFGGVGPVGKPLAPVGSIPDEVAEAAFREQIEALLGPRREIGNRKSEVGSRDPIPETRNPTPDPRPLIDGLILETFYDMREFRMAVQVARSLTDLPIIASKTFIEDADTLSQGLPEQVAEDVSGWGVTVLGTNCTAGPQRMLDIIRQMAAVSTIPISAMPTPGLPQLVLGKIVYDTTPEYFAKYAARLVDAGATIIGGCCGVTPDHIREVGHVVRGVRPGTRPVVVRKRERAPEELPQAERSQFGKDLGKKFQIAVELDLPRGLDITKVLTGARSLREKGASVIDISDGARARLRMNPVAVARLIQEECGIEVMMHFSCRDRNLLAIQADLLGAHALGVRNILAITGDPAQIGDYPTATSVFDIDSIGLVRVLKKLNDGFDMAANTIGIRTNFTIAVAFDPLARDIEMELARLRKKAEVGAQVVYTQPLFDPATVSFAVQSAASVKLPLLVGVLPLRSSRHAEFMHNEVPGIHIPPAIRSQMEAADEASAAGLGIQLARDLVLQIRPQVQGLYLMPPFGNHKVAEAIIDSLREG